LRQVDAHGLCENADVKAATDHGGLREDRAIVGLEPVDTFVDRAADGRGKIGRTISRTRR